MKVLKWKHLQTKMADGCFIILCGIPASGKSTLGKDLVKKDLEVAGKCVHFVYINYDDFIPENLPINDSTKAVKWKDRRRDIINGVQQLLLSKQMINSDTYSHLLSQSKIFVSSRCQCDVNPLTRSSDVLHVIVIDDNMFYRSMRYQYYQLARKTSFGFSEIFFHCPLDVALNRNSQRSSSVSKDTIIKMFHIIEKPEPEKFTWEKFSVAFDSSSSQSVDKTWKAVIKLIERAVAEPALPVKTSDEMQKAKDQAITEKSIVHQADQVLRKHISQKLEEMKAGNVASDRLKQQAQFLNKRRKTIMEEIKKYPKQIMHHLLSRYFNNMCAGFQSKEDISTETTEARESNDTSSQEIFNLKTISEISSHGNLQHSVACSIIMDEIFLMENFWDIISAQEFRDVVRIVFEQT